MATLKSMPRPSRFHWRTIGFRHWRPFVGLPALAFSPNTPAPNPAKQILERICARRLESNPNLTLNLGSRYEYDTPATDPTNRMATFDFNTGTTVQVGTDGISRSGTRPKKDEFDPRVGFAWSPISHTVVRGGYGIYYDPGMFVVNSSLYFNPPFFTISVYFPWATSLITLDDPFAASNGFVPPAALTFIHRFGARLHAHWSFNIQRK